MNFKYSSAVWKQFLKFSVARTEKISPEAKIFQLPQYKHGIIVADIEVVYDPGGFFSSG